jgi:glycosyltransferase involved in cell wall biosynthesis
MVKRPGFELCYAASPQDCHRCFPERDLRSFALRELWLKRFLREVDEFVAPSEFLRRRFIEWGLPPEKIVARENTLPRRDPPRPRDAGSSEVLRTAFFGQLSPVKGLEVFVRAAKLAEKQDLPISFRIYGSDANQPAAFQAKVRDILSDVPTNLSLGGPYRNEDVVSLMAENDVVVVPSIWWENSPVTIQEARLAGCAILGSDIGGVKEKVEASDRGRTFRTGDAYDLVAKLQEMLS